MLLGVVFLYRLRAKEGIIGNLLRCKMRVGLHWIYKKKVATLGGLK